MMNIKAKILQKKNLWHVGAIALFLIISMVYMSPALEGYTIKQADVTNFTGMSREITDYRDNDKEQVLWTNAMFSGMPSTQISMIYEGSWFTKSVSKLFRFLIPFPIGFLFLYFFGFYILGLSLKIKPLVSILGSIAFGLSSYFIIIMEAGHNSKAAAISFAPLMLAGFILTYRSKNYILSAAFAAITLMVELTANHIQITYYMAFIMLFLGVVELIKSIKQKNLINFAKRTGLLLFGYVLAIMINYGNIFGTLEYAKQTIRGGSELTQSLDGNTTDKVNQAGLDKAYVTNWSYGIDETFTFLVPNYKGGVSQAMGQNEALKDIIREAPSNYRSNIAQSSQYWGEQPFTSGPVYIGIIVILLAALALYYVKDRYKWALLVATLLTIALSWGKNYVSALILIPILLYLVNLFIDGKKQLVFNLANSLLLIVIIMGGFSFTDSSLTDLFLTYLPGYNKLRAVTIILVVAELCIPLLGILFLNKLVSKKEEIIADIKPLFYISGGLLLLLIGFYVMPATFNHFISGQELSMLDNIKDPNQIPQYEAFFDALSETRTEIFKSDVGRSIGFLLAGIIALIAFVKLNLSKYLLVGFLILMVFADLFTVDRRYLSTESKGKNYEQWIEKFKQVYPFKAGEGELAILNNELSLHPEIKSKIDAALNDLNKELKAKDASNLEKQRRSDFTTFRTLNRNTNFRVFEVGNAFNSSYIGYFNKSIGGYHGAKLSRYQDLIEFHLSQNNQAVIDMLNTKYYLQPERDRKGNIANSKLVKVNNGAMGNAWLAKKIQFVENADQEINAMSSKAAFEMENKNLTTVLINNQPFHNGVVAPNQTVAILALNGKDTIPVEVPFQSIQDQDIALIIDSTGLNWVYDATPDSVVTKVFSIGKSANSGWNPRETTLVDKRFKGDNLVNKESYTGKGTIEMESYHPDKLVYKSSTTEPQLAVFSEIYYQDGWVAYVNDVETPVVRVNYVLRAINIPAGENEIVFEFHSPSYERAGIIANIGNIGIILFMIIALFLTVKNKEQKADTTINE
ncbi:hypothetical protein DNU06_01130 [Putridiphycobacter roseus]|uniref:YfhO family protein n=1 Tax=Putridiphycobacter roseus TaxID=2219161 RepID=A0A2W1NKT2_9FLAO|nr:hypothetical protein [Putridiphycobacter roseus]PZE18466.1 hypothetical protein DNU06_01130 [Putridiphycobacter roseus]